VSREPHRRPESVLVVVHTAAADILLLRRFQPFSFWQSVTGSLHSSEEAADAAARELQEETGLTDEGVLSSGGISRHFDIDPRWLDRYPPGTIENEEFEWRYRLPSRRDIRINVDEHSAYRWCQVDEAIESVWSWTNKEALQSLRREL